MNEQKEKSVPPAQTESARGKAYCLADRCKKHYDDKPKPNSNITVHCADELRFLGLKARFISVKINDPKPVCCWFPRVIICLKHFPPQKILISPNITIMTDVRQHYSPTTDSSHSSHIYS